MESDQLFKCWKRIDACAFKIYGHWVKKGQTQNRAALSDNTPKFTLLSIAESSTPFRTANRKLQKKESN